jgi:uncharacterized protein with gpF-like domain
MELFFRDLEAEYAQDVVNTRLTLDFTKYMNKIAAFILTFNQEELLAYTREIAGRPLYATTEWWDEMEAAWVSNARTRVAGNVSIFYDKARKLVLDSIRNEVPFDEMYAQLKALDASLTDSRASFIARDLTGKLNGAIEKSLQLGLGINTYFWQTAADERVRGRPGGRYGNAVPSHWAMESLVCDWNNPHTVSFDYDNTWVPRLAIMPHTHPGDDWQCRCRGTPFSYDIMRQIDKELAAE